MRILNEPWTDSKGNKFHLVLLESRKEAQELHAAVEQACKVRPKKTIWKKLSKVFSECLECW